MAIGHLHVRPHSRSAGHSAAAALAYRMGLALVDSRTGREHDYSRRSGVADTGFAFGAHRPAWHADDAQAFADALESAETRKNARIARDIEVSLPHEMTDAQRRALAAEWAQSLSATYAAPVAWALHRPDRRGDARNWHVHSLMATRTLEQEGTLGKKLRVLDDKKTGPEQVLAMRLQWQALCNAHLAQAGLKARITMGRLEEGDVRVPHLGPTVSAMERTAREAQGIRVQGRAIDRVMRTGACVTERGQVFADARATRVRAQPLLRRTAIALRVTNLPRRCGSALLEEPPTPPDGPLLEERRAEPAPTVWARPPMEVAALRPLRERLDYAVAHRAHQRHRAEPTALPEPEATALPSLPQLAARRARLAALRPVLARRAAAPAVLPVLAPYPQQDLGALRQRARQLTLRLQLHCASVRIQVHRQALSTLDAQRAQTRYRRTLASRPRRSLPRRAVRAALLTLAIAISALRVVTLIASQAALRRTPLREGLRETLTDLAPCFRAPRPVTPRERIAALHRLVERRAEPAALPEPEATALPSLPQLAARRARLAALRPVLARRAAAPAVLPVLAPYPQQDLGALRQRARQMTLRLQLHCAYARIQTHRQAISALQAQRAQHRHRALWGQLWRPVARPSFARRAARGALVTLGVAVSVGYLGTAILERAAWRPAPFRQRLRETAAMLRDLRRPSPQGTLRERAAVLRPARRAAPAMLPTLVPSPLQDIEKLRSRALTLRQQQKILRQLDERAQARRRKRRRTLRTRAARPWRKFNAWLHQIPERTGESTVRPALAPLPQLDLIALQLRQQEILHQLDERAQARRRKRRRTLRTHAARPLAQVQRLAPQTVHAH